MWLKKETGGMGNRNCILYLEIIVKVQSAKITIYACEIDFLGVNDHLLSRK